MKQSSNEQPMLILYFILNSKNFVIKLNIKNLFQTLNICLYAIRINLEIHHTALSGLYSK